MAGDQDDDALAEFEALTTQLVSARWYTIGFPGATDFDYTALAPLFAAHMLNNVGDPYVDGPAAFQTKSAEREVIAFVADLFRAPRDDRWGYVTSGASEGNLYALYLARNLYPDGLVYLSEAAHYSLAKAVDLLNMPHITVRTDERGELDYNDLADQVDRHRHRGVIVVANIGTTMTEAVDDVGRIHEVLDALAIRRRFVHADAALSGIPLALLGAQSRPRFDFQDGADSIIVSGHKFPGSPVPSGVVVTKASLRARLPGATAYTGSPDTTVSGSRSGHAPILLQYAIRRHGIAGLRARAEASRELAAYTVQRLQEIGWEAWRNEHAFTVVLKTPPAAVIQRWVLANHGGTSHIVCMPGLVQQQVDAFADDLQSAITAVGHANGGRPSPTAQTQPMVSAELERTP